MKTIVIDGDKHCAECGASGACPNGLCLTCSAKAIRGGKMLSAVGRAVQRRAKKIAGPSRHDGGVA